MRTLEDLERFVEAEAKEEGPAAEAHLHAERLRFRLARQLAEARRKQKLTQHQVAVRSGVPQSEVSKIERGLVNASGDTLARVLFAVRLDLAARPFVTAAKRALRQRSASPRKHSGHAADTSCVSPR